MKISIYGKKFNDSFLPHLKQFLEILKVNNVEICVCKPYYEIIREHLANFPVKSISLYTSHEDIPKDIDFMVSIGGDGTFLESISFVRNHDIPIIGINSGRLGFLANIAKNKINDAFIDIFNNSFSFEHRSLIEIVEPENIFDDFNFALNEVSVQRKGASMITIHTYLNNELLNSYWTDGLIISTPTGTTAYSISVGGPIVVPTCNNLIISPIAPHNLSVRPIVIPDDNVITLKVEGRSDQFILTVDNRHKEIKSGVEIKLQKAPFSLRMVKLNNNSFYKTLRNKMMWGRDLRN